MTIIGIHHVQITVPSGAEDEARQFYCEFLGLREVEKPEALKPRGGFWLQIGSQQVHVGTEDSVQRQQTKAHIAYQVESIHDWRDKLQQQGVDTPQSIPIPGYERFEFRDPFGNRVEMICPK